MKFISLDIETLGLGIDAPIIEVGAVLADTATGEIDPNTYHTYVTHHTYDNCEPYAMAMHPTLLKRIATREEGYSYCRPVDVWIHFLNWANSFKIAWPNDKFVVCGKNIAGFDMPMLVRQCSFRKNAFHHRVLDPGCMWLYPDDEVPPNLTECMKRAGIVADVEHTAVSDAVATAQVVLTHFKQMKAGQILVGDVEVNITNNQSPEETAEYVRRALRKGLG